MTFSNNKAIYLQIADRLCNEILMDLYPEDSRVPSVRDYSIPLEVNVNTTVKSYETLAAAGIIYNRRGLGYFVAQGAKQRILKERREEFLKQVLPRLFKEMELLKLGIEDITYAWMQAQRKSADR